MQVAPYKGHVCVCDSAPSSQKYPIPGEGVSMSAECIKLHTQAARKQSVIVKILESKIWTLSFQHSPLWSEANLLCQAKASTAHKLEKNCTQGHCEFQFRPDVWC